MIFGNLRKVTLASTLLGILSLSAAGALGQPADQAPAEDRSGQQATDKQNEANGENGSASTDRHRGWLGVDLLDTASGVLIDSVIVGSPASKAGLRPGDQIVGVNGEDASTAAGVAHAISKLKPGDKVLIQVIRNGEGHEIKATLDATSFEHRPLPFGKVFPHRALRPNVALSAEVEQMRRRIESLEKQVESLRREVSKLRDMRDKAGSDDPREEKPDKLPPAGGAIDDTAL